MLQGSAFWRLVRGRVFLRQWLRELLGWCLGGRLSLGGALLPSKDPLDCLVRDFSNTVDLIKTIPQDLFAELCERIIQYLQCQILGVDTLELCERLQAAGVEMVANDLAKVVNAISFVFSTAAKNKLSSEELSTRLGNAVGTLPKEAVQVIRHVWNERGKSVTVSEDAKNVAAVGQLVDFQWKLGMAVSSDSCKSLKSPYITMTIKVADVMGHITTRTFEMTVPQFQNFYCQFKEMAAVLETV